MKKNITILLITILSLLSSQQSYANIAEGEVGTCIWYITSEGELVIAPADGVSGDLPENGWDWYWDNEKSDSYSTAPWGEYRGSIFSAKIMSGVNATSCRYMFSGLNNMKNVDLSNFNTENVTSMGYMFYGCSSLTSLDLSNFNTENVTDMGTMFDLCSSLTSLDLSNFNTRNVTSMFGMFYGCSSLTSLDLSNFNTQNVTDMRSMFENCSSLTSLDLSNFNTENVTNMGSMFAECSALTSLDLSNFNTEKVMVMSYMFDNCSSLTSLDLRSFNTQNVTRMYYMFYDCSSLTSLDLSNFDTQNVTDMGGMFSGCSSLSSLDLINFKTENVTDMSCMFWRCSSLTSLDISGFNTQNVTDMNNMFLGCSVLKSLDLSKFNTENVVGMHDMFFGCFSLTSLDLSNFNTENVTYMDSMFIYCTSLTSLDLSFFNTKNVTDMSHMFNGCSSLSSLDLSNFNTENVTDMGSMFSGCSSLTSLDLSNFNTQNVTSMFGMFYDCSSLTSLDLSNFNTENVTDMDYMFNYCNSLKELNLTGFNMQNVTNVENMFRYCSSLNTIISNRETPSTLKAGTFESFEKRADCTLRVPIGTKVLYAAADGWNELGNIRDENDDAYEMFAERYSMTEDHCYNVQIETIDNPAYQGPQNYELIKETEEQLKNIKDEMSQTKEMAASAFEASQMPEIIDVLFERLDAIDDMLQNLLDYFYENTVEAGDIEDSYGKSPLFLTSKIPFYNSEDYTADVVTYTRYFSKQTQKETSAGWETIVLPFNVVNVMTADGRLLAPFGSTLAEAGVALPFWLAELKDGQYVAATSIRANTPYIISMPNGDDIYSKNRISGNVVFFAHNATVYASNGTQTMQGANGFAFVPTYDFVEASDYVYAINDEVFSEGAVEYQPGSVFVHNSRTVRPFEAYMQLNQDHAFAPRFLPVMADETDGIVTITPDTDTVSIYDLSGRKIDTMRKGVNIVVKNGKAVRIVKK